MTFSTTHAFFRSSSFVIEPCFIFKSCLEGTANIYVNNKQYNTLIATKDSILIASAYDFAEIFNGRNRQISKLGLLYAKTK